MNGAGPALRVAACLMLTTVVSGAQAWWHACSWFRFYDDEGTTMLSVRRFLDGRVLYDSLLSSYGPAFYAYQSIPYLLTGSPVDHDSARVLTSVLRVVAGLLLFLLVHRVTGSLLYALAAHLAGFRVLGFMGTDTAHPQELCIVLLLGVALAGTLERSDLRMACYGLLVAAGLLTKINFGLLVATAIAVRVALDDRRWLLALPALAIPPLLMRAHLGETWALQFAAVTVISLASAMRATTGGTRSRLSRRDAFVALAAAAATFASLTGFVMQRGTTLQGMFHSLVILPGTRFAENWSQPLALPVLAPAWALVGWPLAGVLARKPAWASPCKLGFGALLAAVAAGFYYTEVLWVAAPFLWLVAVPGPAGGKGARPLLAVLGVLQLLYAYPVAGSQVAFAVVLIVVIAAICVHDAMPVLPRGLAGAVAILLAGFYVFGAARAGLRYQSLEPLGLRGAHRLRVAPRVADALRRITIAAEPCSMVVTQPQLNSFNLFTGRPAPSNMRSAWVLFLDEAEQETAVRELESHPGACVIVHRQAERMWTSGEEPPQRALVRYIAKNFRTSFEVGGYEFRVRK